MASIPRLRDILSASASAFISFVRGLGATVGQAIQDAAERFPSLSSADIGNAADFAATARSAGTKAGNLARNKALTDPNIPVNATLPNRYRYTATVEVNVSSTGMTEYRTVAIDSDTRLTRGEIESIASVQAATYMRPDGSPKAPSSNVDFEITSTSIDTAERQG